MPWSERSLFRTHTDALPFAGPRATVAIAIACALATAGAAVAADLRLTGTVRDFRQAHPDFEVIPLTGPGHYAANVRVDLGADHRPLLTGSGYKVDVEWTDTAGHLIAPHLFRPFGSDACGRSYDDHIGTAGVAGTGGIASAGTFNEWFRDVPGSNQSTAFTITLSPDGAGVWTHVNDEFHPIDDRLLGNEGHAHNHHLTYAFRADFQYKRCWEQFIEFEGGDGVWVFINGVLVLDIGGLSAALPQRVDLDRLGLTDGETYTLDFFYAQRRATSSVFRLRTTLPLSTDEHPTSVSAMFD